MRRLIYGKKVIMIADSRIRPGMIIQRVTERWEFRLKRKTWKLSIHPTLFLQPQPGVTGIQGCTSGHSSSLQHLPGTTKSTSSILEGRQLEDKGNSCWPPYSCSNRQRWIQQHYSLFTWKYENLVGPTMSQLQLNWSRFGKMIIFWKRWNPKDQNQSYWTKWGSCTRNLLKLCIINHSAWFVIDFIRLYQYCPKPLCQESGLSFPEHTKTWAYLVQSVWNITNSRRMIIMQVEKFCATSSFSHIELVLVLDLSSFQNIIIFRMLQLNCTDSLSHQRFHILQVTTIMLLYSRCRYLQE